METTEIEHFSAHFDGTALDTHKMDIAALAPALMGFGQMVKAAYSIANPLDTRTPKVKVTEFRPGSFEICMLAELSILEQIKGLFSKESLDTTADLAQVSGITLVGLITKAIRWRNKRHRCDDITTHEEQIKKLAYDEGFVEGVKLVARPLKEDGIDIVDIHGSKGELLNLDKADAEEISSWDCPVTEETYGEVLVVRLDHPHVANPLGRKWGFYSQEYGRNTADLLDKDFAEAVIGGHIQFSSQAMFEVTMRIRRVTRHDNSEPHYFFEMVRVVPIPHGTQEEFQFPAPPEN